MDTTLRKAAFGLACARHGPVSAPAGVRAGGPGAAAHNRVHPEIWARAKQAACRATRAPQRPCACACARRRRLRRNRRGGAAACGSWPRCGKNRARAVWPPYLAHSAAAAPAAPHQAAQRTHASPARRRPAGGEPRGGAAWRGGVQPNPQTPSRSRTCRRCERTALPTKAEAAGATVARKVIIGDGGKGAEAELSHRHNENYSKLFLSPLTGPRRVQLRPGRTLDIGAVKASRLGSSKFPSLRSRGAAASRKTTRCRAGVDAAVSATRIVRARPRRERCGPRSVLTASQAAPAPARPRSAPACCAPACAPERR